ncbi:MAG: amidohydrolase family protein [Kouleothrix sp.]
MDVIIKNGTIVTATDTYRAEIGIAGGRIADRRRAGRRGARVIDAAGRYVLPGGVDPHVHLDTPVMGTVTADDYPSGTIAAACGGTTSVVDFCFQMPGQSLADALAGWHARAEGRAAIDYGFHMVVADPTDAVIAELAGLPAQGVSSFKLFMAYKGAPHGRRCGDHPCARAGQALRRTGAGACRERRRGRAAAAPGGGGGDQRAKGAPAQPPATDRGRRGRAHHHTGRAGRHADLYRAYDLRRGAG